MARTLTMTFFILTLFSLPSQGQTDFRVMSYNVENLFDTKDDPLTADNDFLPSGNRHWTSGRFYHKLQQLAKVITAAGEWSTPALIGLCEVENDSVLVRLLDFTPLRRQHYRYCMTHGQDTRGINVAFLYQRDKFRYQGHTEHPVRFTRKQHKHTRNILHVWGDVITGDRIDVFVCHFPSRYGGEKESEPDRLDAARTLRTLCDSIHNLRPAPHILIMGDFNDTPDDTSIREILDAHPIPNPCLSGSGSMPMKPRTNAYPSLLLYNLFAKNRSVPPGSHKYQGEWSQLDQIILSSSLTDTTSQMQLIPGSARIFSPSNGGGFDITIGNPPYISAPTQIASPELNEQRKRIVASKKYKSLNEKWDLYVPFMELGLQLLCPKGIFAMIVPYPLTNQKYGKKLRKMLAEEYRLLEIADLNGTKIFENATVSNCIPFIQNSQPEGELRITQIFEDKIIREVLSKSPEELKQDNKNYVWNLTEEERTGNRFVNMNVLGDFCYISVGMVVNANEKDAQGAFKKEDLISDSYDAIHCRKYIEAKDIDKFQVKRVRYLEWNTERCPDKLRRPTFRELYDCPKLLINRLGVLKVYLDMDTHFLHSDSMFCAVLWKDLKGVYNKSLSSSIKKFCKHNRAAMESLSEKVDLYYLLGILNSSMADQLLADQRGGDYHIYPEHIRNLPIPIPQREVQNSIGIIAKEILHRREKNTDYSELEEQLNGLVEALYQ